jgi:hypothetical protein
VDGAFQKISTKTQSSSAIKIFTANEGIVFYSTTPNTSTAINSCCSFINSFGQNPSLSEIELTGDGSYAITLPGGNVASGNNVSIVWFYAAGAIDDLAEIIRNVEAAGAPSVPSTTPGDGSVTLNWDAITPAAGSELTRYEIECTPDCGTIQVTGSPVPTSKLITGLNNATAYTFRVRAVTSPTGGGETTNGEWSGNSASTTIGTPRNNTIPTISGTVSIGSTLTAADGTWESGIADTSLTTSYQWQACASSCDTLSNYSNISGATNSTFVITGTEIGKKLRAQVTKTNTQSRSAIASSVGTTSTVPTPPLTNLVISNGTLIPTFSSTQSSYAVTLGEGVSSINLTPTISSGTVTVNGIYVTSGTASNDIALNFGTNTITVSVTSGGITSTYTVIVTRSAANSGGGSPTPTLTPTPTPSPTSSVRPNNLINNPLALPSPTPSPTAPSTLVPGTTNTPEPLVRRLIQDLIAPLRPVIVDLFNSPTPQTTSSGTTTNFDNQRALQLAPNSTQDKKVVDLPSLVLVNNEFQPSKIVIVDNTSAQIITPGGGLLNVEAKEGESSVPVDNRGRVQMVRSNNVETEGTGMLPNSEFAVYLFSEPILLGIGKTDAQGKFFASFPVDDTLPIGDHTLQVNGLLASGLTTSISMPVTVVEDIATAKNQAMPQTIFVDSNPVEDALRAMYWILIVLAVMVFLIGASYRDRFFALVKRRKDDEEEIQPA